MACDIGKIEESDREKTNVVIQLNTLSLNELISLTLKLEEEWKIIKKNYSILEGAIVTYDKCKNCVEQLNPSKYEAKNFNVFMNELERLELNKSYTKEQSVKRVNKDEENLKDKEKVEVEEVEKVEDAENIKKVESVESAENTENKQTNKKPLDVHIPLTSLVYIPGKIVDTENFLIRMGTNYYVERNSDQTIEYFNNKTKKLNEQLKKLKLTLIEKKNEIDLCKNYIQIKRQEQLNNTNTNTQAASLKVNP